MNDHYNLKYKITYLCYFHRRNTAHVQPTNASIRDGLRSTQMLINSGAQSFKVANTRPTALMLLLQAKVQYHFSSTNSNINKHIELRYVDIHVNHKLTNSRQHDKKNNIPAPSE